MIVVVHRLWQKHDKTVQYISFLYLLQFFHHFEFTSAVFAVVAKTTFIVMQYFLFTFYLNTRISQRPFFSSFWFLFISIFSDFVFMHYDIAQCGNHFASWQWNEMKPHELHTSSTSWTHTASFRLLLFLCFCKIRFDIPFYRSVNSNDKIHISSFIFCVCVCVRSINTVNWMRSHYIVLRTIVVKIRLSKYGNLTSL